MCLNMLSEKEQDVINKKFLEKFKDEKEIVCYKVLKKEFIYNGQLDRYVSPYRYSVYKLGEVKNSNRDNKKLTNWEKTRKKVNRGIHVHLSRRKANENKHAWRGDVVVKVICKKSDFVSCDSRKTQAVFTKVFFLKQRGI